MDLVADAAECARRLAERRGVRITELTEVAEHDAAVALLTRIWQAENSDDLVNTSLLRALAHSGNYVAGAWSGTELVGVAVAFFGVGHLHSHITGVDRSRIGGGIGAALKQHQRAWALARGTDRIGWTFDPLLARNAYFNLHRLGATATEYLVDFYGTLSDGVNEGDHSDRLFVDWRLDAPAAVAAAHGEPSDVDVTGAVVLLDADARPGKLDGEPTAVVAVPPDAETLRRLDPVAASRWRIAVRSAFQSAFSSGYSVAGITRDARYLLHRKDSA